MTNYILYYVQAEHVGDGAETTIIGTSHNVAHLKSHVDVEVSTMEARVEWSEPAEIAKQYGGGFRYEGYVYSNEEATDDESIGIYIIQPVKEVL